MKRQRILLIGALLLCTIVGVCNYFTTQKLQANIYRTQGLIERARVESTEELADSLIRFHVLANSDSREDQRIKHLVRDKVLKEVVPHLQTSQSLEETRRIIQGKKDGMIRTAEEVLRRSGKDYGVMAALGNFSFPTKYYGNFSLPAGEYEAFRIVLGEGKGANWWCVMFPPLCFVNVDREAMQEEQDLEELIEPAADVDNENPNMDPEPSVRIRWKFLEFLQSIFE